MPPKSTIQEVKDVLAEKHGLNMDKQCLVRCSAALDQEYVRLEENRTLEEYGMKNDTRLRMIPLIRSGPFSEESTSLRYFVGGEDGRINAAIDRMLQACGKKRNPGYKYYLAQLDSQKPGDFTILEVPDPTNRSLSLDASETEVKQPTKRVLSSSEQKQNVQTLTKMKQLRESLDKRRRKKKTPPPPKTPVAKMELPCGSCGAVSSGVECPKCDQIYCAQHVKGHVCQPSQNAASESRSMVPAPMTEKLSVL